jgi:hypothetical protein
MRVPSDLLKTNYLRMKKNNKQKEALEIARKEALEFYKKKAMLEVLDYKEQNGMLRVYLAFKQSSKP